MTSEPSSCGLAREKLPLYVGGDLEPDTLAAVREHLERCPACAEAAREAARGRTELVQSLLGCAQDSLRPGLWPSIRSVLQAEGRLRAPRPDGGEPSALRRPSRARVRWVLSCAAAAALAATLLYLAGEPSQPARVGPDPESIVQVPEPLPIEALPVAAPLGGLRRIAPSAETLYLPAPYREVGRTVPTPSPVSAAGYRRGGGMK
jgi:predicted anti-sigma-YlaC factor YlaD